MEQETKKVFNKAAKDRYKWGNKPGKYYLVKALKYKKSSNYIEKMKNIKGEMVYKTTKIANVFQSYYSAFCSVRQKETQEVEKNGGKKMQDYLRKAKLLKAPIEKIQSLKPNNTR